MKKVVNFNVEYLYDNTMTQNQELNNRKVTINVNKDTIHERI